MKKLSTQTLVVFAVATVAGACLHFVWSLLPNVFTALISPVNESIWEHLKILYWPFLLSGVMLTRKGERGCRGPWAAALLISAAGLLIVGYFYHIVFGGDSLLVDIVLYVVMMALAFVLAEGALNRPWICAKSDWLVLLVLALGCGILLFTFLPLDLPLFADFSKTNTWARIPC